MTICEQSSKSVAKTYAQLVQGITFAGTTSLGRLLNRNPSYISRIKTGEQKLDLSEVSLNIPNIGYELQDARATQITMTREKADTLTELASRSFQDTLDHFITPGETITISKDLYHSLRYLAGIGIAHIEEQD